MALQSRRDFPCCVRPALPVPGSLTVPGLILRKPRPLNKPVPFFLLACLCVGSPLLAAAPAVAQQVSPAPASSALLSDPSDLVPDFNGNYLTPLLILRPLRDSYTNSPMWRDTYFETLAAAESFVCNDAKAVADFDARSVDADVVQSSNEQIAQDEVLLKSYTPVDARQAILAAATDHQAIFLNEAHHVPMDRAFTLSLLPGLYAKGFRYFAAETLNEKDTGLQARGYPTINSGYYTREPVFGDLVRTAIKIGYKVVPYEHLSQSDDTLTAQNQRERGEAQNLYDRIFKNNLNAKVLVYGGYGHIAKATYTMRFTQGPLASKPVSGQITQMALWFQKISKIVPFSVDQADMMEHSAPQYENFFYRAAIADNLLQEVPIVLKNKSGRDFVYPNNPTAYDLIVFHPRVLYEFGRPTWLSLNGQRQAYVLPDDLGAPANASVLAQAFYENEPAASAIPVDQVEILPGLSPRPALMLPAGRFHLRVVNGAGQVLRDWHIDRDGATP